MANAEIKKGPQVNELSKETLKSLKSVVRISMDRVRFGNIDNSKKTQSVVLKNLLSNRIYKLTTHFAEQEDNNTPKYTGLDIERINIDRNNEPFSKFNILNLPTNPKDITKENLALPRGLTTLDIGSIPNDIDWNRGREVKEEEFFKALTELKLKN